MLSLWSALNPNVWVSEGPAGDGTWTIPPSATVGPNTGEFSREDSCDSTISHMTSRAHPVLELHKHILGVGRYFVHG